MSDGIRVIRGYSSGEAAELAGDFNIRIETVHSPANLTISRDQWSELTALVRAGKTVNIFVKSIHYSASVNVVDGFMPKAVPATAHVADSSRGTKHVSLRSLKR